MSWFVGYFKLDRNAVKPDFESAEYEYKFDNDRLCLYSDRKNTRIDERDDRLDILCGTLLFKTADNWRIQRKAWLSEKERNESNGHFAGLRYQNERLELYNDCLGLRDIYYYLKDDILFFATRADLLMILKNNNKIYWENFGSYWLNGEPLGQSHFVRDICRLHQEGRLQCSRKGIRKSNKLWTAPVEEPFIMDKIYDIITDLEGIILAASETNQGRLLALSGGADSRALLALLMTGALDFETVTWGNSNHPDVIIADRLSKESGFPHRIIYRNLLAESDSWEYFENYCTRSQLLAPGTLVFELNHYNELDKSRILVDGGAGAFFRRRLNVKLEYYGKKIIRTKNTKDYLRLATIKKSDIFQSDLEQMMKRGLIQQTEEAFEKMPEVETLGMGNWIDTWSMRYRTGNISSRSLQILDDILTNYMPYLQPDLLRKVMKIPAVKRKTNIIQNEIINQHAKELFKIPRIRYGLMMPFKTGRLQAKIRSKLSAPPPRFNTVNECFLQLHKERIFALSEECRSKSKNIYDPVKLKTLVVDYYRNGQRESELVWWLTFECYRRKFNISG